MLQKLPDAILVKILEKTKRKTNQNCRLLNSRFDNIIKKFELHKKDVYSISIFQNEKDGRKTCEITIQERKNSKLLSTKYNSCPEMMTAATQLLRYKFHSIFRFELYGMPIDDNLIQLLTNEKCLRTLSSLGIYRCFFKCNSTDKWFSYLSQLQLNDFTVLTSTEDTLIPIPETILDNVSNEFSYQNGILDIMENEFELPWMNDLMLEKWFSPEKMFYISQVKTAFTLEAVMRCIKMLPLNTDWYKDIYFDFGLLENVTSAKCERLLTDACGSEWSFQNYATNVKYFHYDAIEGHVSQQGMIQQFGKDTGTMVEVLASYPELEPDIPMTEEAIKTAIGKEVHERPEANPVQGSYIQAS